MTGIRRTELARRVRRARCRVTEEVRITGTSGPSRARQLRRARSAARSASTRSTFDSASSRGQGGQPRVVQRQLALDRRVVGDRVGPVERAEVEHVDEQPGALDVGEELVSEPGAGAGALDQARDVGDHQLAVVELERAEHRLERRERVVRRPSAARA